MRTTICAVQNLDPMPQPWCGAVMVWYVKILFTIEHRSYAICISFLIVHHPLEKTCLPPDRTGKEDIDLAQLKRFARYGGPSLRHLKSKVLSNPFETTF